MKVSKKFAFLLVLSLMLVSIGVAKASPSAHEKPQGLACTTTTWIYLYGNVHTFINNYNPAVDMQSGLRLLVDSIDHTKYCGYVWSESKVKLYAGCLDTTGAAYTGSQPNLQVSVYDIYHCTPTSYSFEGPLTNLVCNYPDHLYSYATDNVGDYVYYGPFNC